MSYKIIDSINYIPILESYHQLESKMEWDSAPGQSRQCGVQYSKNNNNFTDATGRPKNQFEQLYSKINPLFENTIFEEVIKKYKMYRTRFMWVGSKSCYTIHRDRGKRLHIPLITNKNCMFIFPGGPELVHLPVGNVYLVDTTRLHSFCNFSTIPRLHLVGCVSD
jgi:hypothetical protein